MKGQSEVFLHELEKQYNIPGKIWFEEEQGGLIYADISNDFAQARVFLQGAHLTHFQPQGQKPLIWLSSKSFYEKGKSIRGGIPVCWPWFGDHPDDPAKPAHGFARTSLWQVDTTGEDEDGTTFIRLFLLDDKQTRSLWPHAFRLELTISVGKNLVVTLKALNTGQQPFICTGALHSYFSVSEVSSVEVTGLNGCSYLDKVDSLKRKHQCGPVRIQGETDRVYLETSDACTIKDPFMKRSICIDKKGSMTTVVWNPGPEKAALMADMGDAGFRQMVCVETANAADDKIKLSPGQSHILQAEISISSRQTTP